MFTYIFTLLSIIYGFLSNPVYRTYMGGKQQENRLGQRGLTRLGGFGRNSSGASALEFAMVAGPFLLLVFGILAVGLVFAGNMTLENAIDQGARLIRTGEAQSQGFDAAKFKSEVCKYLTAPLSCGGLKLDVRTFATFGSSDLTNPLDSSGNLKSGFSYAPGVGGDVVVVRAFYEWDLLAAMPQAIRLSNMPNGNRLLIATAAFRNEPFK
jgi:Flp pilus assembly protein TadG